MRRQLLLVWTVADAESLAALNPSGYLLTREQWARVVIRSLSWHAAVRITSLDALMTAVSQTTRC